MILFKFPPDPKTFTTEFEACKYHVQLHQMKKNFGVILKFNVGYIVVLISVKFAVESSKSIPSEIGQLKSLTSIDFNSSKCTVSVFHGIQKISSVDNN